MSCPTCDHAMHHVGVTERCMTYWCPRCGSLKEKFGRELHEFALSQPKLVERVVEFCGTLTDEDQRIIDNMERLGVTEAATHPEVR